MDPGRMSQMRRGKPRGLLGAARAPCPQAVPSWRRLQTRRQRRQVPATKTVHVHQSQECCKFLL